MTDLTAVDTVATLSRIRSHWDGMIANGLTVEETSAAMTRMMDALMAGRTEEANEIALEAMGETGLGVAQARMAEFKALAKKAFAA